MAGKVYTAQEMRNCAGNCDWRINPCVAAMLRQAADDKERMESVLKHLEKYKGTEEPDYCCADCIEDIAKEVGFSFVRGEERKMPDTKNALAEQASRIALWSGRADELRQQCDRWYKAANDARAEVKNLRGCLQEAVNLHCGKCINKGGLCNSDCLFDKWKKALKEDK